MAWNHPDHAESAYNIALNFANRFARKAMQAREALEPILTEMGELKSQIQAAGSDQDALDALMEAGLQGHQQAPSPAPRSRGVDRGRPQPGRGRARAGEGAGRDPVPDPLRRGRLHRGLAAGAGRTSGPRSPPLRTNFNPVESEVTHRGTARTRSPACSAVVAGRPQLGRQSVEHDSIDKMVYDDHKFESAALPAHGAGPSAHHHARRAGAGRAGLHVGQPEEIAAWQDQGEGGTRRA
jgi:hypothetical protein